MHFVNAHNFIPRGLLWSSVSIPILILGGRSHALSFTKANPGCSHHRKPLAPKTHLTESRDTYVQTSYYPKLQVSNVRKSGNPSFQAKQKPCCQLLREKGTKNV